MTQRSQDSPVHGNGSPPLIAEVFLSGSKLLLVPTIKATDGGVFELEGEYCTTRGTRHVFVSVGDTGIGPLHEALRDDDTIRDPKQLADFDGRATYWSAVDRSTTTLTAKASELGGLVLQGIGRERGWTLRLMLADRDVLRQLRRYYMNRDTVFRVQELYHGNAANTHVGMLSKDSREILLSAYRQGYYEVPRQVTQGVLAEEWGISRSAVSKRLRRATAELVQSTLSPD